ncbi:hypothetical protein JVT61DRAFT_12991 [Boletus reticuloceps]|uniref:Protein EFR3 n=1 Tax=Boletus reticuloceps TaxID=495285 RepID=A0A8I2YXG7_9AGAM|nr:hypothetical protein JVT61DRAFT_12991 [Boletus reticuloceps]
MHLFTPNHVALVAACYPPWSSAAPEYRPNPQELSRLTYYATNRPGKIHKLGAELEKHTRSECTKTLAGNTRARASLLITLAIIRALAIECRRDISLLSPSLLVCLKITLELVSSDLEISARAASVVHAGMTQNYLVVLGHFAKQSIAEIKSVDYELRNRTRVVGLAAITGVVNSEALYISSTQFKSQASRIIRALLFHVLQSEVKSLDEWYVHGPHVRYPYSLPFHTSSTSAIKDNTPSVYMEEFRTRPPDQRRAASIHVHIDGQSGPSSADVLLASLRAISLLLQHSNSAQIALILQAAFETMDDLPLWDKVDQSCWFARKACEWTQYQYRYTVPSQLVERLLETHDTLVSTHQQRTLTRMLTTVFTSPISLINLSTSDIVSNLVTLVLRRVSVNTDDDLLPFLVESIGSLGTHVYYSDQIQDLASELISRLVAVQVHGSPSLERDDYNKRRSQAIRCLLAGLSGLLLAADAARKDDHEKTMLSPPSSLMLSGTSSPRSQVPQRKRVSGEIWYETLNLLCDGDHAVRSYYAHTLVTYLRQELAKPGNSGSIKRSRQTTEESSPINISLLVFGDPSTRSLHATHAYLFMLATSSSLGYVADLSPSPAYSLNGDFASIAVSSTAPSSDPPGHGVEIVETQPSRPSSSRRSAGTITRSRKVSNTLKLSECTPQKVTSSSLASLSDHALILHVLTAIHEELPIRGLLTGIPMLLSLDAASQIEDESDLSVRQRAGALKEVINRVWLVIGQVWECAELIKLAERALSSSHGPAILPQVAEFTPGVLRPPEEQVMFPPVMESEIVAEWSHVNAEEALSLIVSSRNVQEATGMDRQGLLRRLTAQWSAEAALKDSLERPSTHRPLTENGSPLLKLSPALMAIENLSLQSLTRSVRGVGVTDLREALEGRAGASNPTLAHPPSVSTLDHALSFDIHTPRLAPTKPKPRFKKRAVTAGSGEVREVLNKLGIGRPNGTTNLLKASFPSMQKSDHR